MNEHPLFRGFDVLTAELSRVLDLHQEDPLDPIRIRAVEELALQLAGSVAGIPKNAKYGSLMQSVAETIQLINKSGFLDLPLSSERVTRVMEYERKGWPGLLAVMFLSPSWRLAKAPAYDALPMWLWPLYTAYLFYTPQGFCAVGDADAYLRHYRAKLSELLKLAQANMGSAAVRSSVNYFVSASSCIPLYFTHDSLRDIYEKRAKIFGLLLAPEKQSEIYAFSREGRRLRIGFVNRHFAPQTETYTTLPSFEHLDPERFEVVLFAMHKTDTKLEEYAANSASEFVLLPEALDAQVQRLREAQLDVIVFGTNVTAVCNEVTKLALFRMAPLQVVNNSSCTTTGMPEVDVYVSGDMTEEEGASVHFSERLGLLPGPSHSFNYEADMQAPVFAEGRDAFGIPEEATLFVSAANYYKITPEMMHVWAHLLKDIPGSYLLLHPFNPNWSSRYPIKRFCALFDGVLGEHGVDDSRLIVSSEKFPSRSDVKELMALGDVYLDTFPFGGVNSLVDPLEKGVPVVVWDGETFRSRMGGALLRSMGLAELVARDEEQYASIAKRLAEGTAWAGEIVKRISEHMARAPLFLDTVAASDSFGFLIETAYDMLVDQGRKAFRATAVPLRPGFSVSLPEVLHDGKQQVSAGDWHGARESAMKALSKAPNDPAARFIMGRVLIECGSFERAALYLSNAVQLDEQSSPTWTALGDAFFRLGRGTEAVRALEVAIRLDSANLDPVLKLAEIALSCGDVESYQDLCSSAKEIAPYDPRVSALI